MSEIHSTYRFSVRWQDGKLGLAGSPDGLPDIEIASPPQFGGPGGRWTPEHFFVGAATSCWLTTFLAIADLSRLEIAAVEAAAEAVLERGDDRRFSITRIVLRPRVTVRREGDRDRAARLIRKAEDSCLVARSMRAAVVLEPEVAVDDAGAKPTGAMAEPLSPSLPA
jgi:peroxiredoxin-like protein